MLPLHLPAGDTLQLLCLGAHPDDIEIGSAGTLLRLLAEHPGTRVHWVVFTSTPEREREARASAEDLLGGAAEGSVAIHAFRDGFLPSMMGEVKDVFEALKAEVSPDLVLTHHGGDAHQDHRVLSQLAWNTFRDHLILEYEIPKYDGDLGTPNVYVPLSETIVDRKIESILRHFGSQHARAWFEPDTFRSMLRLRGMECNAPDRYAEAFHGRKLVL